MFCFKKPYLPVHPCRAPRKLPPLPVRVDDALLVRVPLLVGEGEDASRGP